MFAVMRKSDVLALASLRRRLVDEPGWARGLRVDAGLTQSEVGSACGVKGETVCRWEIGDRRPQGLPALRYARLLAELEDAQARTAS
jgi:DNA-binding transcriptional regulator YiaG